jgi:dimethylargininase
MARVFDFGRALVRTPAPSVVEGLRTGPDVPCYDGILVEHHAYVAALEAAGLAVETLPPLPDYPDSLYVEDPAFVLPEGAIVLKPGAATRQGEAAEIAHALHSRFAQVLELDQGFADGGDIVILRDEILIGLSARTDEAGARCFCALAAELGRRARIVATPPGVLHLKTACALVDEESVIATPALAAAAIFGGLEVLQTPGGEDKAANLLRLNDTLLVGNDYPRTIELLAKRAPTLVALPVAENRKIDAGLSCHSLRW